MGLVNIDVGKAVDGIVGALDGLFTSDEEREQKKIELMELLQRPSMAQVELNKIEAAHRSVFVAGWRPAIGWTCAAGLAWHFLGYPFGSFIAAVFDSQVSLPTVESQNIIDLVIAMLGLGAYRSYEKVKGAAK